MDSMATVLGLVSEAYQFRRLQVFAFIRIFRVWRLGLNSDGRHSFIGSTWGAPSELSRRALNKEPRPVSRSAMEGVSMWSLFLSCCTGVGILNTGSATSTTFVVGGVGAGGGFLGSSTGIGIGRWDKSSTVMNGQQSSEQLSSPKPKSTRINRDPLLTAEEGTITLYVRSNNHGSDLEALLWCDMGSIAALKVGDPSGIGSCWSVVEEGEGIVGQSSAVFRSLVTAMDCSFLWQMVFLKQNTLKARLLTRPEQIRNQKRWT